MKRHKSAAIAAGLMAFSLSAGAYAATDPGPGWTLLDQQTIRYFEPGNVPPGDANAGSGISGGPGSSDWLLTNTETIRVFVPAKDSGGQLISTSFSGTSQDRQRVPLGQLTVNGSLTKDAPYSDNNPAHWASARAGDSLRYSVPRYQVTHQAFSVYNQYGWEYRTISHFVDTYRVSQEVDAGNGVVFVDNHTYTQSRDQAGPWGSASLDAGLNQFVRNGVVNGLDRLSDLAFAVATNTTGAASRAGSGTGKASSFLSDKNSGASKERLDGSFKRKSIGADKAAASKSKERPVTGGIALIARLPLVVLAAPTPAPTPTPQNQNQQGQNQQGQNQQGQNQNQNQQGQSQQGQNQNQQGQNQVTQADWVGTWTTQLGTTFTLTAVGADQIQVSVTLFGNTYSEVGTLNGDCKELKKDTGSVKFAMHFHQDQNPVNWEGDGRAPVIGSFHITPAAKQ